MTNLKPNYLLTNEDKTHLIETKNQIMKKDELSDRMKTYYENRTKTYLPRRTYTIIRLDGKAFHTYTKGLKKPFDVDFISDMDDTACYLCKNIQGVKMAFVQSDEISILLTDFEKLTTDAWYDGNVQKITSVSASLTTGKFNELRYLRNFDALTNESNIILPNEIVECLTNKTAFFDSRTYTIPNNVEVENYFIWRQQDTIRNSVASLSQSLFSSHELYNKNTNQQKCMCVSKNTDWNDLPIKHKHGRLIVKQSYTKNDSIRTKWVSVGVPLFTEEREILTKLIPIMYEN